MNFIKLYCLFSMLSLTCAAIIGVNMYGLETEYYGFSCDWSKSVEEMVMDAKNLGFNTIRVPFSLDFVFRDEFKILDNFMYYTKMVKMDIILDCHRLQSKFQSPKMYNNVYSFSDFLRGWEIILERYKSFKNLKYVDIFNEWQDNDCESLNHFSTLTVLYLEEIFKDRFTYIIGGWKWGGKLQNIEIDVPFDDRILYSIHKYHFSNTENYEDEWENDFAGKENIIVGEYGFKNNKFEMKWGERFINWLHENGYKNSVYWCLTSHSPDTGGIYKPDNDGCSIIDDEKINIINKIWL